MTPEVFRLWPSESTRMFRYSLRETGLFVFTPIKKAMFLNDHKTSYEIALTARDWGIAHQCVQRHNNVVHQAVCEQARTFLGRVFPWVNGVAHW